MKVLYFNRAFERHGAGPAVHGHAVVEALRARGVEVRVFPEPGSATSGRDPGQAAVRSGLHRVLPSEPLKAAAGLWRSVRLAKRAASFCRNAPPDVVLARHAAYDWAPGLIARSLRRPLVLEVNAPVFLEKRLAGVSPPWFLRSGERAAWLRADRIVCVSDELAAILRDSGVDAGRVVTIPNGANPLPWRDRREGEPVRVVFVGGFHPWHGVDQLLDAFVRMDVRQNLRLVLVGDGPDRPRIERIASSVEAGGRIELLGNLPHERVIEVLLDSDIAVAPYPALRPFYFSPLKVYEYMAAGLPIVAPDQGQISDIVRHGGTGLLYPPGDVAALADAMSTLASDAHLRVTLGREGHRLLQERHTWQVTGDRLLDVLRSTVPLDVGA